MESGKISSSTIDLYLSVFEAVDEETGIPAQARSDSPGRVRRAGEGDVQEKQQKTSFSPQRFEICGSCTALFSYLIVVCVDSVNGQR